MISFRLLVVATLLLPACRVYDPSKVRRDAESESATSCRSRRAPPRPQGPDSDGEELVFAFRHPVLDQGERWSEYGLDLDAHCTLDEQMPGECVAPATMRAIVDGPEGVDNVFGQRFFPIVAITTPNLQENARAVEEAGQGQPVVRLLGYNGQPNDPVVDLHLMQSVVSAPGMATDLAPPAEIPDVQTSRPRWDGNDWMWMRSDAFASGDLERPLIRDDHAYVADGVLVARLPQRIDIVLPSEMYGVLVRLTDGTVTGRIELGSGTIDDIKVTGRWSINDLLVTASNIGICRGEESYGILLGQLEAIADVRSDPATAGGADVRCDAISAGAGFSATRVRIAGLARGRPLADLCAALSRDGGVADATDGPNEGPADAGT